MTRQERRESAHQVRHRLKRERGQCTWCGGRVPKGRRQWCSQQCVDEFMVRNSPGAARSMVEKRDRGVCALCGLDTNRIKRLMYRIRELCRLSYREYEKATGFGLCRSCWEADHIVPFSDGGPTTLENLRTLCLPCHKQVTREFAAERARRRKADKQARSPQRRIFQDQT